MAKEMCEQKLFDEIEGIVREAGRFLLDAEVTSDCISQKDGPANFVTKYDVEIQKYLIEKFSKLLPTAEYYGEENTAGNVHGALGKGYLFFIDPIDGTTNFMFDYKHSCISVGLACDGKMIAGFVYNPYTDEMYSAVRGKGAWLNGRRLHVADKGIADGIAAFGCARYNDDRVDLIFHVVKELFMRSLSVRNGGSAALDLCRVAGGANVSYLELKLQPYDYAAASVIVEEAGGKISQVNGDPITLDGPCSIVAGTPAAVKDVMEIVYRNDSCERVFVN